MLFRSVKDRVSGHDFDHEPELRRCIHPANFIAWHNISSLCACLLVSCNILAILVRIDRHVVKACLASRHKLTKYGWLIIPLANKLDLEITSLRQCCHAIWCLRWTSTIHCTVPLWTPDGKKWADPCRSDPVHTSDPGNRKHN